MPDQEKVVAPFAVWLTDQRSGLLAHELAEGLAALTEAVSTMGKGGMLTLKVSVKPSRTPGMVEIIDTVTTKLPEPDRQSAMFFVLEDGSLSRSHPNQPRLPLKGLDPPAEHPAAMAVTS